MSNHLAIATVTSALRQMLYDAINDDVNGTEVTIYPPDDPNLKNDSPRLNLFLYQVIPNTAWKNADLPTRRRDGSQIRRTQLGLDLHYLLTVYGNMKDDPEAHRILGSAVRTFHEHPILTRQTIRGVLNQAYLAGSDIADQVETVKITAQNLSLEELSKLWSVFFQIPYRISLAYQVSVVLIDGKGSPKPGLPVQERNIYVLPFRYPAIFGVEPQMIESAPGAMVVLKGRNLSAKSVSIRFGDIETTPDPPISDKSLIVTLPQGLSAGVNPVQVIHKLEIGTPKVPHRGFESNVAAFVLRPRIITPPPYTVQRGNILTLDCEPPVGRAQRVSLLLGEYEISIPARPATGPPTSTSLEFPIPVNLPAHTYIMRLRIDGAESLLERSTDPEDPVYTGPILEVL